MDLIISQLRQIKVGLIKYIKNNRIRILKFLLSGSSAAIINLGFLYILIAYLQFNTRFLENIANALSMEISIIYNFIINRQWTWRDAKKEHNFKLIKQFLFFHLAVVVSIIIRLTMFPILQFYGVNYLINATVGIGVGAIVNYILYDKVVFKRKENLFHE